MSSSRRHQGTTELRRPTRKIQPYPPPIATAPTPPLPLAHDVLPLSPPLSVKSVALAPSPPLSMQHSRISGRRLQKPLKMRQEVVIVPKPSASAAKNAPISPPSTRDSSRSSRSAKAAKLRPRTSSHTEKRRMGNRMGYDNHVVVARRLPDSLKEALGDDLRMDLCLGDLQAALTLAYIKRDEELAKSGILAEDTEGVSPVEGKVKRKNGVAREIQKGSCWNCGVNEHAAIMWRADKVLEEEYGIRRRLCNRCGLYKQSNNTDRPIIKPWSALGRSPPPKESGEASLLTTFATPPVEVQAQPSKSTIEEQPANAVFVVGQETYQGFTDVVAAWEPTRTGFEAWQERRLLAAGNGKYGLRECLVLRDTDAPNLPVDTPSLYAYHVPNTLAFTQAAPSSYAPWPVEAISSEPPDYQPYRAWQADTTNFYEGQWNHDQQGEKLTEATAPQRRRFHR